MNDEYLGSYGGGKRCKECLNRIKYENIIDNIMWIVGVGVLCGNMYSGEEMRESMFDEVFNMSIEWMEEVKIIFVVIGECMGELGMMILFVGWIEKGEKRKKVYREWRERVGGSI